MMALEFKTTDNPKSTNNYSRNCDATVFVQGSITPLNENIRFGSPEIKQKLLLNNETQRPFTITKLKKTEITTLSPKVIKPKNITT